MEETYRLEPLAILRRPGSAEELEEYETTLHRWDQVAAREGVTFKVVHFEGYDVLAVVVAVVRVFWSVDTAATPPQSVDSLEDDVLSGFRTRSCDDTDQDEEEEEVCCICLDDLYRGSVTSLDCRHEFHPDCIWRWLFCGDNFCPLCKAPAIKEPLHLMLDSLTIN